MKRRPCIINKLNKNVFAACSVLQSWKIELLWNFLWVLIIALFLIWAVFRAAEYVTTEWSPWEAKGQCNCQPHSEEKDKWKTKNSFTPFQGGTFHLMRPLLAHHGASAGDSSCPCFASSNSHVPPNRDAVQEQRTGVCHRGVDGPVTEMSTSVLLPGVFCKLPWPWFSIFSVCFQTRGTWGNAQCRGESKITSVLHKCPGCGRWCLFPLPHAGQQDWHPPLVAS